MLQKIRFDHAIYLYYSSSKRLRKLTTNLKRRYITFLDELTKSKGYKFEHNGRKIQPNMSIGINCKAYYRKGNLINALKNVQKLALIKGRQHTQTH